MCVCLCLHSGGHLNPAFSLTVFITGQLSLTLLLVYTLMQYLGAIAGSACVYGIYYGETTCFKCQRILFVQVFC